MYSRDFRGVQDDFSCVPGVLEVFQDVSRMFQRISVAFSGFSRRFRGFKRFSSGFRGVLGNFKAFQGNSRSFRAFHGCYGSSGRFWSVPGDLRKFQYAFITVPGAILEVSEGRGFLEHPFNPTEITSELF